MSQSYFDDQLDQELEMVLELSKKTFIDEEKRRSAEVGELQDLMVIQSPKEIQRNQQIEEIKKLYNMQKPENEVNCSYMSSALISFGSDRRYGQSSTLPSSMSLPQMMSPPTTPFIAAQTTNPFYMPLTQSQSATINCNPNSNLLSCSPPFNKLKKKYPEFSQHNPFVASTSNTHLSNLASSTLPTPTFNTASLISPLKIPFRPTNGSDLIDFQSCANDPGRTAMEEFDPLYKKLSLQGSITPILPIPELNAKPKITFIPPQSSANQKKANSAITRASNASFKSRQISFDHKILLTCEDLKIAEEYSCDFYKEKKLLIEQIERLKSSSTKSTDVFFLAPVVDYFTTTADSIKLVVYQDDTWRKDVPEEQQKLEFACDLRSTNEEILVDVLLKLLPQEVIDRNGGDIPLTEYTLKVYGFDEFLVPAAVIGKHPFVAYFLSQGKDVVLEVGKRVLVPTAEDNKHVDSPSILSPVVNKDLFYTFKNTMKNHVEKCLANPQDRKLRQGVVQSVKMLTTFMNNVQPPDLVSAIDMLYVGNSLQELSNAVHFIVLAVMRLLKMYCNSTLTNFSIPAFTAEEHQQASVDDIRESSNCQDKVLLSVETLHNLPSAWQSTYRAYFVEAHLMYGPKSYGLMSSDIRSITSKYHFSFVSFQFWAEFEIQLPSLPRESQLCFIVRGIPIVESVEDSASNGCSSSEIYAAHRIATASLPLYNHEGFLLQGPVLLPLTLMSDDTVHPWGPRPLIRNAEDPVLVVKCLEYEYQIQFPQNIFQGKIHWQEFENLSSETQNELLIVLGDGGVNSTNLNDDDKQFLWTKRNYLHHIPKALPLVLASSFSWGSYSLSNIYLMLDKWASLPPNAAIELLLPYFQDCMVRKKAVEYISSASSEFLFSLLTQFVEALRYETFENSALAVFLLEQSTRDRRFAFELYWQLQHRIHDTKNPSYSARCQLLQQMLLDLDIAGFRNEVGHQHVFLDRLDKIAKMVKEAQESVMNAVLHKELYHLLEDMNMRNVRLPIAPAFQCKSFIIDDCGYFNSLTKPIKIIIRGRRTNYGVIFKVGDDLRQDAIVLQLVRVMNDIWLSHQLDLRMIMFRCLPTGSKKGMIELVADCSTLREIQTTPGATGVFKDDVLNSWLVRQNQSEFQYKAALENFRRSCAGWCVTTYVLGIGDRHNDNILVTTTGHVFHIDFGKYMGDWQTAAGFKRDRVPFVLTADMTYVINGGSQNTTEHFQKFIDDCCKAFNLLRQNCSMIINIMRFMSCSDIPGMNPDSVSFVESNLMLDLNEVQATMVFTRMIEESLRSRFPRLNFFAHTLAQFKNNPMLLSGKAEDMNQLSFITETYTGKMEGRIETVNVISQEKWRNPEKVYMYKLRIRRQKENVCSYLYRSFPEFQEFRWKLCYRFSSRAIPPLSLTSNLGRTNVRTVAMKRQLQLEGFLQALFRLSDEVAHSDLVYTFFHTLYRDSEPEIARAQKVKSAIRHDINSPPQLHLRLSLDETRSEFRVFVGHAKQLPLVGTEKSPDSYVKTYLRQLHSPQQKHYKRKTLVVKCATNPTYNAELIYSLGNISVQELTYMILDVSVWHSGTAVLKDNFQLCEVFIPLISFQTVIADRKGIKLVEKWYVLTLSPG